MRSLPAKLANNSLILKLIRLFIVIFWSPNWDWAKTLVSTSNCWIISIKQCYDHSIKLSWLLFLDDYLDGVWWIFCDFFQWPTFFFFKEMFIFCQTQITCILTVSAEDFVIILKARWKFLSKERAKKCLKSLIFQEEFKNSVTLALIKR